MNSGYGVLLAVILFALVVAFGPWLAFWAVGVLFGFHIPLTLKTWAAALVLLLMVAGR